MKILCEYCDTRCVCYDDWMDHLLSDGHQEVISEAIHSWEPLLNEKSLVITIEGQKPDKIDLCWYFANYGLVADAYFGSNLDFIVIQLDKKDYAQNALLSEHHLENATLTLRLKADVSDAEWLILTSMVRRRNETRDSAKHIHESFASRHIKIADILKPIPLISQMDHFGREAKLKSVEVLQRQRFLEELTQILKKDFSKCILCPFGSFVTGLGSVTSTLHVYFDATGLSLQNGQLTEKGLVSTKDIMEYIEKLLANKNRGISFCYDLISSRNETMPFVKFTHCDSGVTCKFTFDSLHPVQTSKLIGLVMTLDPRLPNLFLFVRYWGEYHELTGETQISNYSLNLLLLVFLTKKKIIPSISVLQTMSNASREINGWETSFCDDPAKIISLMTFFGISSTFDKDPSTGKPTAQSILRLVAEFCKMYAHTDLQSQVACPIMGDFLPKRAFEIGKEAELPKPLEAYTNFISARRSINRLNTNSLLCIQDPFDLSLNVSRMVPESTIWKFQFVCADTVDSIQAILSSPNSNMMDMFQSQSAVLEDENEMDLIITKTKLVDHNHGSQPVNRDRKIVSSPKDKDSPSTNSQPKVAQNTKITTSQPTLVSVSNVQQRHQEKSSLSPSSSYQYQSPPSTLHSKSGNEGQNQYPNHSFMAATSSQHAKQTTPNSNKPSNTVTPLRNDLPNSACGKPTLSNSQISPQTQIQSTGGKGTQPTAHDSSAQTYLTSDNILKQNHEQQKSLTTIKSESPPVKTVQRPNPPATPLLTTPVVTVMATPVTPALKTTANSVSTTTTTVASTSGSRKISTSSNTSTTTSFTLTKLSSTISLKFGDIERIFKFPIEYNFERLFRENVGNLVSDASTRTRMNVLWCSYLKDFLLNIWWKSFQFELSDVTQFYIPINKDKKIKEEIVDFYGFVDSQSESEPPLAKKIKIEPGTSNPVKRDFPVNFKFDPRTNPHKQKFFDLQSNFVFSKALLCSFSKTFTVGRGSARSSALADSDLIKRFPDPLDLEGEITRRTAAKFQRDNFKYQFVVKISLDSSNNDNNCVVVAIKDIKVDPKDRGVNINTISHILSVLNDLIPRYQNYRLNNWLASRI